MSDDQPGNGQWRVADRTVDPQQIACPVLEVTSATDRIVPMATAAGIGRQISLQQGHVGMIVGGRARAMLWEPLATWLSQSRDALSGS
jgi:polyhydroxyalkanoate synthase